MANLKQLKENTFASISAAQTILEKYPYLEAKISNSLKSINVTTNPFDFLMDLFRTTSGYDGLISILAKFLTLELNAVELALKTILKVNLRNIISCSINPMITDELINNGIWFDLSQIDAMGQLLVYPLDKEVGKYFYFGCDDFKSKAELINSNDLNAVLWYTINEAVGDNKRVVWDNKLALSKKDRENPEKIKPVITMEFVERSADLKDITGTANVPNAIPLNNVIHIFLGDAKNEKTVKNNRYWKKTMLQFNNNYIDSIKLFDAKVVAAQIIDRLIGASSFSIGFSVNQILLRQQINELVRKVIENDDTEIDDCFFSFSNEEYDDMLNKSELEHSGFFSYQGELNTSNVIDPKEILKNLDGISAAATKEEQTTIIEGAMYEISGMLSKETERDKINFGVQMNFIEHTLYELCSIIVSSLISPKLYLLLAMNISLTRGTADIPSIYAFLLQNKKLILEMIKLIRDLLVKYLFDELMKILKPIIELLAVKMVIENVQFYKELITQLLKAYNFKRENGIFNMDVVNYADILSENTTPQTNNC